MALRSEVKFLSTFSQGYLTEGVSGETLSVVGSGSAVVNADGSGYQMSRSQYLLKKSIDISLTNAFTLAFNIIPKSEGLASSGLSTDPIKASVLDFGVGSGVGENFVMTSPVLIVYEIYFSATKNKMVFVIHNTSGDVVAEVTSSAYDVDKTHNFVFVYDGAASEHVSKYALFIDGTTSITSSTGTIPASIATSTIAFAINRYAFADTALINNEGIIDDVVLTTDIGVYADVDVIANIGVENFVDAYLSTVVEQDFGLLFDDPSPVRVNDAVNDGSSIILARTDGVLAEGSRLLWENRRDFSDDKEIESLTATGNTVEQEARLLKLDDIVQL